MVKDHLGNEFKTLKEMCRHYGVEWGTFVNRQEKHWTLKQCLLGKDKSVKDHRGKEHPSLKALCEAHGVSYGRIRYRVRNGWSIEDALNLGAGEIPE